MSHLIFNEQTADLGVAGGGKVRLWADNTPRPKLKTVDDNNDIRYLLDDSNHAASTSAVSAGFAADTYVAGSGILFGAGKLRVQSQYYCCFDMVKTAAGVAQWIATLRLGTAGTTSDAAILTFTGATAQTAAADTGTFELWANVRSIGSGTSAVIAGVLRLTRTNTTTGFLSTGGLQLSWLMVTSSGFNSTTQTNIGVSFNGGTSFSGTTTVVQSRLVL